MYRHKRSSLALSLALVATTARNENPVVSPKEIEDRFSDPQSGRVCSVNTLRPCCGQKAGLATLVYCIVINGTFRG